MTVLGISGLDASAGFKQRQMPGQSSREAGMVQGLNSAAAIVDADGPLAAAAEERFCREKGTGRFPQQAIEYCLRAAQLKIDDVAAVAHAFEYESHRNHYQHSEYLRLQFRDVFSRGAQLRILEHHFPGQDWDQKLVSVPHHLAHAAGCFLQSGMDQSLILVADGMGERDSMTVALGEGAKIDILEQVSARNSLGILYGIITHFLGFRFGRDEYKVMGMAPLGNPRRFIALFDSWVNLLPQGQYTIPLLAEDQSVEERETHRGVLRTLTAVLGPARLPTAPLSSRDHDVAAALQATLERTLLHVLSHHRRRTGQRNLCMSGGVALNCAANGVLHRSRMFKHLFVQPAAGDDGAALGAALYVHNSMTGQRPGERRLPFWGPEFTTAEVELALSASGQLVCSEALSRAELVSQVADRLARGQVIAWFQGRMEFGPRALGHRSILADPRDPDMRDHINRTIKERESFRPFAPAVLCEDANKYFEILEGADPLLAAMLSTALVRPECRQLLPAVTHVDGTARVQVVSRRQVPVFAQLLAEFGNRTGIPVLLNTSFNIREEPIVCSPTDAIRTLLDSKLDALAIDRFIVVRRP